VVEGDKDLVGQTPGVTRLGRSGNEIGQLLGHRLVSSLFVRDYDCIGPDYTIENHGAIHERLADALCNEILAFSA
jgi:hypothetical protein